MNYLDELLALYSSRDPLTQKYILSTVAGVPVGFDSSTLLEFLWSAAGNVNPAIRHQARLEMGRIGPRCVRYERGLEGAGMGVWSIYARRQKDKGRPPDAIRDRTGLPTAAVLANAMDLLGPCLKLALTHLESASPRLRWGASLVAGQMPTPACIDALARLTRGPAAAFGHAAALAELGTDGTQDALVSVIESRALDQPDLLLLLSGVSTGRALPILERFEARTDAYGRANMAKVLGSLEPRPARELLGRLIDRKEGWTTAYALDSLAAGAQSEDIALIAKAYARESHEFIRLLATRAAGFVPGPEAVEFLRTRLELGLPRVQAAALEGLVRQQVPAADLGDAARRLLSSPLLKARVVALLVLMLDSAGDASEPISNLLFSPSPVERLEGAFILGYTSSAKSASVLAEMAGADPCLPVQVQAIKSLARQPASMGVDRLLLLLSSQNPMIGAVAARALAGIPGPSTPHVLDGLVRAARSATVAPLRGSIMRSIGAVAARQPRVTMPPILCEGLQDAQVAVVMGALDGIRFHDDAACREVVNRLLGHVHSRVRARAGIAAVTFGNTDGVEAIERLLAASDEEEILLGLEALLELCIVVPAVLVSGRESRLLDLLSKQSREQVDHPSSPGADSEQPTARLLARVPESVRKVERPPPARPSPLWARARRIPSASVVLGKNAANELRSFYREKGPRPRPHEDLPPAQLVQVSDLIGLGSAWGRLFDRERWREGWTLPSLAALLVLGLMSLILAHARVQDSGVAAGRVIGTARPIDPLRFRVSTVEQPATASRDSATGTPIREGDALASGDTLATGASGSLSLVNGDGDIVWLGPLSRVQIESSSQTASASAVSAPIAIVEPSGDVFLDFRRRDAVDLVLGTAHVAGRRLVARVRGVSEGRNISLAGGTATLSVPGESDRLFRIGDVFKISPGP